MSDTVKRLQWLWGMVARLGVPDSTIHLLVEHAQDMETARIQTLLEEMLQSPERLRAIDGDIIVRGLRDALETKKYRAK